MNNNTTVSVFKFKECEVRTVMRNGEPWFVASDICSALDYANPSKAIADHVDEDERYNESLDRGGKRLLINESGLYALVLRSRKPSARKFAKWVTSEVLPTIRKTGKFDAKTNSGPLTKEMRETIKNLVIERAKSLPSEKQASVIIKTWSALKAHFGVTYKEIPIERYAEAVSLVARMQVEWEIIDDQSATGKDEYHFPLEAADPHGRKFGNAWLTQQVLLDPRNRQVELELLAALEGDGHDVMGAKVRILALREHVARYESERRELAEWGRKLRVMGESLKQFERQFGKNVLFVKPTPADDPIIQHVYRDQLQTV